MNEVVGLRLGNQPRPCGVCGTVRKLSRTHVPPQAAGNTGPVTRKYMLGGSEGYRSGREYIGEYIGGIWVYGLCMDCNSLSGGRYDRAYADFAAGIERWFSVAGRVWHPDMPAIRLAPGLVTRSVLYGMLAISPNTRVMRPSLAEQLLAGGPVRLPGELSLRVATYLGRRALLTGPILTANVLGTRSEVNTLAAFTFRPLTWALAAGDSREYFDSRRWADATEWLLYEDDRVDVDVRWLTRSSARTGDVLHAPGDELLQLFSSEIAPIVEGRIPGRVPLTGRAHRDTPSPMMRPT
ncbi:hypothetical protein ACFFGH_10625 [Lysobacter korlensis]|uniref:HNH endonuclease n=1 Tax=Lysobacter korlensis TaxID=553636 RepID=A0ABV6RNZ0_9GAMM